MPNKMFYLFAVGGNHNGISVSGIGIDSAMKVMYETQRKKYWYDTTNFSQAMYGSLQAAERLDPSGITGIKFQELLKAWEAVKVCVPNGNVDGSSNLTPDNSDVVFLIASVFLAGRGDWCAADLNCSGTFTPADVVVLLNMVYRHTGIACPYTS